MERSAATPVAASRVPRSTFVYVTERKRVEACTEDDILLDPALTRPLQAILCETSAKNPDRGRRNTVCGQHVSDLVFGDANKRHSQTVDKDLRFTIADQVPGAHDRWPKRCSMNSGKLRLSHRSKRIAVEPTGCPRQRVTASLPIGCGLRWSSQRFVECL
jgi:hypothetical protein